MSKAPMPPRKKQLKGAGRDQFREFIKFFQDPDNAQDLIKQIKAAPPFDPTEDYTQHGKKRKPKESDDDAASASSDPNKPYKGPSSKAIAFRALQLHLDYSNQPQVFLAVFYLNRNLPKALEHRDEFLSKVVAFKALAAHLDATEPMLKGVTGMALLSLHERVVQKRKELMDALKSDAMDASQKLEWRDTKLSDAARSLIGLDDQLSEAFVTKVGERKYKKHRLDTPSTGDPASPSTSSGPAAGGATAGSSAAKKHDQMSAADESEGEPHSAKAAGPGSSSSSTAKPTTTASAGGAASGTTTTATGASGAGGAAKDVKKEKKEKATKGGKAEPSHGNHHEAMQDVQKGGSKSSSVSQSVVDMLVERIKALEDEVKELRRKTYDNTDAIKELKWQHVTQ